MAKFKSYNYDQTALVAVDLAKQQVITPGGETFIFEIDAFRKQCLLQGLDEISLTLQHAEAIRVFEKRRRTQEPWLF